MSRGRAVLPAILLSNEAAGADATPSDPAAGVLTLAGNATRTNAIGTLTLVANPSDTETVSIGGLAYTFQTVLTNVARNVLIGADASATLDNLIAAINAAAGAGTLYAAATVVHPSVVAAAGAGDTMVVQAKAAGTAGNAIATVDGMANAGNVWGAATLASGAVAETVTIGLTVYRLVNVLAQAYDVLIGANASATIDNLIAAVNGAAGEGTTYGTDTDAHPDVVAAAGTGDTMDVTADTTGTVGNSIATTDTMAQGSWGAVTLVGGAQAGAEIPAAQRTSRGWVIARRGAGGSGAVTVANAYLRGLLDNGEPAGSAIDAEEFVRCAELGSMNIAAGEGGFAKLVEGMGAFKRLSFNSDAIAADTVDVYYLPIED